MRKWKVLGGAVAVLCVGILTATLLPATGQTGGKRFVLCEKDGKHDYEFDVDNPPKHFSAGDQFIFSEPEFDVNGHKVGKIAGVAHVIRTIRDRDALVRFNVSFNLEGGRIEVLGTSTFGHINSATFAIVGGTGKYEGKTGVVKPRNAHCDGVGKKGDHAVFLFD